MLEKICRLCFDEKPRPIGIFTAIGVKMNIGETIRLHFADEVSEMDHFPKLVCFDCWTKLKRFHEFYKAVNAAKNEFILKFVKNEEPELIKIDCDAVGCEDDMTPVKIEPHVVVTDIKPFDDYEMMDIIEQFDDCDAGDFSNHVNDTNDDERLNDPKINDANAKEVEGVRIKANGKCDDLIPEYLNMICEICEHPFKRISETRTHFREKHNIQNYIKVKCCQRQILRYVGQIRDHIQCHFNPNEFKCTECNKMFMMSSQLNKHMRTHSHDQYECDFCKKIFFTWCGIFNHMKINHMPVQEQHECKICKKRFKSKHYFVAHLRLVHERRFQQVCHICAKVFTAKRSLLEHLKEHNDVKNPRVNCTFCGKSSKNKRSLQNHVRRMHEPGGKVYKCPHCQKQCASNESLRAHIAYNHNFKIYTCAICATNRKTPKELKKHMTIHTSVDLYKCDYCPTTFKFKTSKFKHTKQIHPTEFNATRAVKLKMD